MHEPSKAKSRRKEKNFALASAANIGKNLQSHGQPSNLPHYVILLLRTWKPRGNHRVSRDVAMSKNCGDQLSPGLAPVAVDGGEPQGRSPTESPRASSRDWRDCARRCRTRCRGRGSCGRSEGPASHSLPDRTPAA